METQSGAVNAAERRGLDKSTLIWSGLGCIIIVITAINLWTVYNVRQATRILDFNLTNQHGESLGLSDLDGKIWVADFIFTNCPTICPSMTQEMARLQSEFAGAPISFVSFSVDPERDTPEVLSRYAAAYGADEKRWHFLTGDKAAIYGLAEDGFSLAAGQRGSEIFHSSRFALIAADGSIHGYYDSQIAEAMQQLRQDINVLLRK